MQMKEQLDRIPDVVKRFGVPIGSFVVLVLVMGLDPNLLQEYLTYLFIGITAVTGYTEYRRFRGAQKAAEKKLPSHDVNGS